MKRICVGLLILAFAAVLLPLHRVSLSAPGSSPSKLRRIDTKQSQDTPRPVVQASSRSAVFPSSLNNVLFTVQAQADLAVGKSGSPNPVTAGNNLTYTLFIKNDGPSDAQAVTLTDPTPTGTTFVSATQNSGPAFTEVEPPVGGTGNVVYSIATLATGAGADFTIVVKVNASTSGFITNTASSDSTTLDPNSSNDNASLTTGVETQADLAVTKTDSPDPVPAGENIIYSLTLTNNGPSDAVGASLTDTIPTNTTYVAAGQDTGPPFFSLGQPPVGGTGNVAVGIATLAAGASATFTIAVKVNASALHGSTITNTATADSLTQDVAPENDSATANTAVQALADIAVTKTDSPDPVAPGANITYTINFTNNGPSDAQGVSLTDEVLANTTLVSVNTPTGWTRVDVVPVGGAGNLNFTRPVLPAGASSIFTLVVKLNPNEPNGTIITNQAFGDTSSTDLNTANDSDIEATGVQTQADLAVTKTGAPNPVPAGQNLTYSLTLTNNGPNDAQTVTLTDPTPPGTTFVSSTQNTGPVFSKAEPAVGGTGNVIFSIPTLAAGATATFTIVVNVNSSTLHGTTITNTATATSTTTDPGPGPNSATATTTVQASADLGVVKTDTPDPVTAGTNLTYGLTLTNFGPSDAQTVTLTDPTPPGTTFVSSTQNTGPAFSKAEPAVGGTGNIVFSIPTLAAGATATFTIVVNVNASATSTITNTATAASTTFDPDASDNSDTETTTVQAEADLAVIKTDSPDPVTAGTNLTYTLTLTNNGPSDAQSVTVTDPTPLNTTFVSASQNTGPAFTKVEPPVGGTGNVVFSIPTFAAGASATFTIIVKVNANAVSGSTITNTVTAAATTFDPNTQNNSDTETTLVQTSADLAVTKTDSPDPVAAGANITYTLTLTNNGPSDAQAVTLTDVVPANTTFVSAQQTAGPAFTIVSPPVGGTGNVVASIVTLAAGATATFEMVVKVNANVIAGTVINNTATAASTTPDPGPGPNTAAASTAVIVPPTIFKSFAATDIDVDGITELTLVIGNLNATPLTGVAVSDTLPAGLVVGTPSGVASDCGGTVTAADGSGLVSLTGGTLAGNDTCSIVLFVKGTTPGPKVNTTGPVSATETGAGGTSTATVTVHPVDIVLTDPPVCLGPGGVVQVTATVTNAALSPQNIVFTATPDDSGFVVIPGSCTASVGTCNVVNGTVSVATTLGVGETLVVTYQGQVGDVSVGGKVCSNAEVTFNGGTPITVNACSTVNCPEVGPGDPFPSSSVVSDQKAGSVLIYNLHTSNGSMPNVQNARISVTNVNPTFPAFVHLFFIDGATCSIADSSICLTANQTLTFLASDLDPGTTGYIVAVAVNSLGCPISFNYLIGDEYVKFASGHAANLAAEAISALPGGLPPCDGASDSALLAFDNVSYGAVARVLAVDGIADKASGNDMLLAINRIGGDFRQGALGIGNLFGILYNDEEQPHSWTLNTPNCQFVSLLSDAFPLTSPRFETVIPAGGTGWMRFWTVNDVGILGSKINFNPNVASSENAYNQGSNLHKLKLSTTSTIRIPVLAPGC